MNKINNIEFQKSASEVFLDAVDFFTDGGVKFINSRTEHRYSLSILIDDGLKKPVVITPFCYAMSRNALASLYVAMVKNERFGGKRRIASLIKVINRCIANGYKRHCLVSHNIETGKYRLKAGEVIEIWAKITSQAIEYSLGGDKLEHLGDLYSLLGGELGTYTFFKEVMLATESSIPSVEDVGIPDLQHLKKIKCYTCKYCKCDRTGIRTCAKSPVPITGEDFDDHPNRYTDAHHENDQLVSSIIDERMRRCINYERCIK